MHRSLTIVALVATGLFASTTTAAADTLTASHRPSPPPYTAHAHATSRTAHVQDSSS